MIKTLALILKKQNIGETDRIVTVFSPTLGKKRVIARAVRRTTSKLAGHLDTFMLSQLILTEDADLPKVTSAVLIESFENVRESLPKLERAFAVSKIVERVILEDVSQQSIFQLTLDALSRINSDEAWPTTWLMFLSELAHRLGLQVTDFHCSVCAKEIRDRCYWLPNDRIFRCQECAATSQSQVMERVHLSINSVKLLHLLRNKSYSVIRPVRIPSAVAKEVEELFLREVTQWFNKPWSSYASLG